MLLVDIQYSVVYNPDDSDINRRIVKYALIFYEINENQQKNLEEIVYCNSYGFIIAFIF